jgi:hypothetical protein
MSESSSPPDALRDSLRKEARAQLWRSGDLRFLLDANQLRDYEAIWSRPAEDYVLDVSRQTGKSWLLLVIANEFALTHPGARIPYASLTQKSIIEIIEPAMEQMLADCPADCRPKFNRQACVWEWPNGSRMPAAGTDNKHYTALRGPRAHLILKDEVGFFEDPEEVDAVLSPQRLTTGGIIIEASTPPVSPAHPWSRRCQVAKAEGRYSHRTIWEHARMSKQQIEAFLRREATLRGFGSYEDFLRSTVYRREYLAEHVVDETRAVVPMWNGAAERLVREVPRPRWFLPCEGFDFGFRDGLAAVFGHWDYKRAAAVVEDELLLFGTPDQRMLGKLAEEVRGKERALWPLSMPKPYTEAKPSEWKAWAPFGRWGDNDLLVINELAAGHGLNLQPTRKDDKELQVAALNQLVAAGKLLIHPRCKRLVSQLATTVWNKQRTSYERNAEGHGDVLDALLYWLRNLPRHIDPAPPFWDADPERAYVPEAGPSEEESAWVGAFS